jgi:hypothetical protein
MGVHKINVLYKWLTAIKIYSHSFPYRGNRCWQPFPGQLLHQQVPGNSTTENGIYFTVNAQRHGFVKILYALHFNTGPYSSPNGRLGIYGMGRKSCGQPVTAF